MNDKKTKICIPIVETTIETARKAMKIASEKADLIEWRVDFLDTIDLMAFETLITEVNFPLIITCRLKSQGGTDNLTEKSREKLLEIALKNEVAFIDLEHQSETTLPLSVNTTIIRSHHDFEQTPSLREMEKIISTFDSTAWIKYIPTAKSSNDNFKVFELLKNRPQMISFCMGIKGQISRILAGKYGSAITFAALSDIQQSANGQISIDEMLQLYRADKINSATQVYGIIGQHAENSKSKYMHNPAFQAAKLNAVFVPFKIDPEDELKDFMANFRTYKLSGAAVTIPHKETVMQYLDDVDETAKTIGAVNTIRNDHGKLIGYNTDCLGAIAALKKKTDVKDKRVLLLGAGGAARAIVYALKREKARVTIANRTAEKAKNLAQEFDAVTIPMSDIEQSAENYDIFINTTSVGMTPHSSQSVMQRIPTGKVVMDIVYNPLKTKLLTLAEEKHCTIITGEHMLIHQAIAQQEIWTGQSPDFDAMRQWFFEIPELNNS